MTLTLQELIDWHDSIKDAQDQVQSEYIWDRLEAIRVRLSDERVKMENPDG